MKPVIGYNPVSIGFPDSLSLMQFFREKCRAQKESWLINVKVSMLHRDMLILTYMLTAIQVQNPLIYTLKRRASEIPG
jgi:hypothetical protein